MSTGRRRLRTERDIALQVSERELVRLRGGLSYSLTFVDEELFQARHKRQGVGALLYELARAELVSLFERLTPGAPSPPTCNNCDDAREIPCEACGGCGVCCTCPPKPQRINLDNLHAWLVERRTAESVSPLVTGVMPSVRAGRLALLDELVTICVSGRLPVTEEPVEP